MEDRHKKSFILTLLNVITAWHDKTNSRMHIHLVFLNVLFHFQGLLSTGAEQNASG